MTLATRLKELETIPDCATCGWYQQLPDPERLAFDEWVQRCLRGSRQYTREGLWDECVKMGYPLKVSVFKDCVRRHHVHQ